MPDLRTFPFIASLCCLLLFQANTAFASGSGDKKKKSNLHYEEALSSFSLPSTRVKDSLGSLLGVNSLSKNNSSRSSTSMSGNNFEGCGDETEMLDSVDVENYQDGAVSCPDQMTTIEREYEDYPCIEGRQLSRKLTTIWVRLSELFTVDDILEIFEVDEEEIGLSNQEIAEKLSSNCLPSSITDARFGRVCVNDSLRPGSRSKVYMTFSLNGDIHTDRGEPSSVKIETDDVVWDTGMGTITSRTYTTTSHQIKVRPDSDDSDEDCGYYKIGFATQAVQKMYFGRTISCDEDSKVRTNAQWSYKYGSESATDWDFSRDFNLIVNDFFNECTRTNRYWFGDRLAPVGTINGVPQYWTPREWFHIRTSGRYLWDEDPVGSNWNGTYIFRITDLPEQN